MAGHLSDVDVSFSSYFFSIVLVLIFFRLYHPLVDYNFLIT